MSTSIRDRIAEALYEAPRYPDISPEVATPILRDVERLALLAKGWSWAYNCINGKFEVWLHKTWEPSWERKYVVKGKGADMLYEAMVNAVVKLWMM